MRISESGHERRQSLSKIKPEDVFFDFVSAWDYLFSPPMFSNSPLEMSDSDAALSELRRQVDEIDSRLHDLLMHRTTLARRIRAAKKPGSVFMRPGREAVVLRRLVRRHRGEFPKAALVRIWREIFSVFTALQGPFSVAVFAPPGADRFSHMAHDHFGSLTGYTSHESTVGVIQAVSDGQATVGVLPLPSDEVSQHWWRHLARNDPSVPRIIARLPFAETNHNQDPSEGALAISLSIPDNSDADCSCLVVEANRELSRGALRDLLMSVKLDADYLQGWSDPPGRWLHMMSLGGYLSPEDSRLAQLLEGRSTIRQAWVVGGYAAPLGPQDLAGAEDNEVEE